MKSEARKSESGRRHHDRAFKAELVGQSLQPGASVAAIALQNGINANLLFKWRRNHLRATRSIAAQPAVLLPVHVEPGSNAASSRAAVANAPAVPTNPGTRTGVIELEIAGAQLRLRGAIDEAMLSGVLRALRQSA